MGVWDNSADVAADSGVISVQGAWRLRPDGNTGSTAENLQPWIEWKDVMIDEGLVVEEMDYEDVDKPVPSQKSTAHLLLFYR